ncbi:MAG: DsbA family protein [Pseudomonadota bacterium]
MLRVFLMVFFTGMASLGMAQDLTEDRVKQLALEAILENPDIIMQAVRILEQQEATAQAAAAATVMGRLTDNPDVPTLGDPNGDVVVVEFFDYNCGYCRRAGKVVADVLNTDPNVKIILREWPILGADSVFAARASLAARMQGKYADFHWAMMNSSARASEATVLRTARETGLDMDQLQQDMQSEAVNQHIAASIEMAKDLGFTGTPAFVVGDTAAPGFIELDQMQELIAAARAG